MNNAAHTASSTATSWTVTHALSGCSRDSSKTVCDSNDPPIYQIDLFIRSELFANALHEAYTVSRNMIASRLRLQLTRVLHLSKTCTISTRGRRDALAKVDMADD